MKRFQRTSKKMKKKTPGGKTGVYFKKKKPSHHKCKCKAKLNRAKLTPNQLKKLPKVKRRPERPYPEMCSGCMRQMLKESVR
jgi:large subunit ribosomal protein L34e